MCVELLEHHDPRGGLKASISPDWEKTARDSYSAVRTRRGVNDPLIYFDELVFIGLYLEDSLSAIVGNV